MDSKQPGNHWPFALPKALDMSGSLSKGNGQGDAGRGGHPRMDSQWVERVTRARVGLPFVLRQALDEREWEVGFLPP